METESAPPIATLLRKHLAAVTGEPTIVGTGFPRSDHANVQRALDHVLQGEGRTVELVGVDGSDQVLKACVNNRAGLIEQVLGRRADIDTDEHRRSRQ